jgi:hypothetical protein
METPTRNGHFDRGGLTTPSCPTIRPRAKKKKKTWPRRSPLARRAFLLERGDDEFERRARSWALGGMARVRCASIGPVLALAAVVASIAVEPVARAQGPERDVVVVDVTAPPTAIDAAKLRAAIGQDLSADVVAPEDARAAGARGTVSVGVDSQAHRLTVAYRARSEAVTREMDLPDDPQTATRAAVVLAGNLARDEAGELAAELRKKRSDAARAAPPPMAPAAAADDREATARDARLLATLEYYAGSWKRTRLAAGVTFAILGGIAVGTGYGMSLGNGIASHGDVVESTGSAFAALGVVTLLIRNPLERLAAADRNGAGAAATEDAWVRAADTEHSARLGYGIALVTVGAIAFGVGVFNAFDGVFFPHDFDSRGEFTEELMATGGVCAAVGVISLATEGPVEGALRSYEAASGRTLTPAGEALLDHLHVAPTRGGASAAFSFRF